VAVLQKACINSAACVFFIAGSFLGNTLLAGQSLGAFKEKCEERCVCACAHVCVPACVHARVRMST
jgi:hypothetical protein